MRGLAWRGALALPRVRHDGPVTIQRVQRGVRRARVAAAGLQGGAGAGPEPQGCQSQPGEQAPETAVDRAPPAGHGRVQVAAGGLRGAVRGARAAALAQRRRRLAGVAAAAAQCHVGGGAVRGAGGAHAQHGQPLLQHLGRSGRISAPVATACARPARTTADNRQ